MAGPDGNTATVLEPGVDEFSLLIILGFDGIHVAEANRGRQLLSLGRQLPLRMVKRVKIGEFTMDGIHY